MGTLKGSRFCYTHSPENAEQRFKSRSLGGKAKRTPHNERVSLPRQIRTVDDLYQMIDYAVAELEQHDNTILALRVQVNLIDAAVKIVQAHDIERRLTALEERANEHIYAG